jgi:outer membrane murein-binding lipoprotein Lpp
MCSWKMKVRGVRVFGRQVYLTDAGIRLGITGPLVSYEDCLGQLSNDKADELARNVQAIRAKIDAGQIDVSRYPDREQRPVAPDAVAVAGNLTARDDDTIDWGGAVDPDEARLIEEAEYDRELSERDDLGSAGQGFPCP